MPDLTLYLKIDMDTLIPRALESGGINYWEAGMDMHMGQDLFDSFVNYQSRLIAEYDRLAQEFGFEVIDGTKMVDEIQEKIREKLKEVLGKPKTILKSKEDPERREDAKK